MKLRPLAVVLIALLAVGQGVASAPAETCSAQDGSQSCTTDPAAAPSTAPTEVNPADYFTHIPTIKYEGPDSKNPFAFRWYNADEVILGKPMKEWLRFSLAFWHTMRGDGSDPFGSGTKFWPWEDSTLDELAQAKRRLDVFFEIAQRLGVEWWCFHDRDIAPEKPTLEESNAVLDEVVDHAQKLQEATGVKLLWGTAQLFKHPRYAHGAATSPNATVFAWAAGQVKKAMEVTHKLGGANYVFWGGREGYSSLLNTDMALELDNLARFMRMAVKHKKRIGFKGTLLLEPKPKEPTKHQYDWDAATTHAFLLRNKFAPLAGDKSIPDFKLNIECNHATLAGHSCVHDLQYSSQSGLLGNIDANTGDPQLGWDTDQFLTDPMEATLVMQIIVKQGGLGTGGINFDAKLRRESTEVEDLFLGHISGMDALARGLRNAAALLEDGRIEGMKAARYSSYVDTDLGKKIVNEKVGFEELAKHAVSNPDPHSDGLPSGKQELYEILLSTFVR